MKKLIDTLIKKSSQKANDFGIKMEKVCFCFDYEYEQTIGVLLNTFDGAAYIHITDFEPYIELSFDEVKKQMIAGIERNSAIFEQNHTAANIVFYTFDGYSAQAFHKLKNKGTTENIQVKETPLIDQLSIEGLDFSSPHFWLINIKASEQVRRARTISNGKFQIPELVIYPILRSFYCNDNGMVFSNNFVKFLGLLGLNLECEKASFKHEFSDTDLSEFYNIVTGIPTIKYEEKSLQLTALNYDCDQCACAFDPKTIPPNMMIFQPDTSPKMLIVHNTLKELMEQYQLDKGIEFSAIEDPKSEFWQQFS